MYLPLTFRMGGVDFVVLLQETRTPTRHDSLPRQPDMPINTAWPEDGTFEGRSL